VALALPAQVESTSGVPQMGTLIARNVDICYDPDDE